MAKILIKLGYLGYEGKLYGAGAVVDVANAEDIIARAGGCIVLQGQETKDTVPQKNKTAKPAREAPAKPEEDGEELASLPEADPAAAVKK